MQLWHVPQAPCRCPCPNPRIKKRSLKLVLVCHRTLGQDILHHRQQDRREWQRENARCQKRAPKLYRVLLLSSAHRAGCCHLCLHTIALFKKVKTRPVLTGIQEVKFDNPKQPKKHASTLYYECTGSLEMA